MRQRTALTVAMVLTTFVLLIAASVIGRLALSPTSSGVATAAPLASDDPTAQGFSPQREAEYQQQLATANARLEQANRQLEDAYRRLTPQPSALASPESTPSDPVTASARPAASSMPSPAPSLPEPSSSPFPSPSASGALQTPARITADQAAAAARAYVGGGTVERVELEEEHGQLVYEVRFTNNSRVYVDAVSGAVVYARLEDEGSSGDDSSIRDNSGSGSDDRRSGDEARGDDRRSGRADDSSGNDDRSDRDDRRPGRDD